MMEGEISPKYTTLSVYMVCLVITRKVSLYYIVSIAFNQLQSTNVVNATLLVVIGLAPGTSYTFSVTAENAVSSQDTDIAHRTVNTSAITLQGG